VVTAGAATDKGGIVGHGWACGGKPKMFYGSGVEYVFFPTLEAGGATPIYYDGTNPPARMPSGSGANGQYLGIYKSRVVVGGGWHNASGPPPQNRAYFSPIPNPLSAWDAASYIDFDHPITGFASLQNALLVFSWGTTERLIGATPPPDSDM